MRKGLLHHPEAAGSPTHAGPVIRLRGVERSYPAGQGRTRVLRQIDLEVRAGEFVTVMGRSGAGKSTPLSILDRFGIVAKRDLDPSQLPGGQQQLVGVARAVIANPKLLLADEPAGNLHSAQPREIMDLFQRLNAAGATVIQVTHSETNAACGGRVVELRDGWIVGDRPAG